jgi:hypothetical protein
MKLKEVIITHRDSCKTYPLKRIGLHHLINWENDTPTIKELYESSMFEHLIEPEIGCILIWRGTNKDAVTGYITQHKITEDGHIISIRRFDYGHCGVYEGNNMFSDCRFEETEGTKIHMRYMNDVSKPDYILKLKE